jgi:hypothetical protein
MKSEFAFAQSYTNLSSKSTPFSLKIKKAAPFPILMP